ncbi:hypothetical protein BpHYR1_019547 [Brachionus plicatilis]|uniref:Uncharacterized protein n=1 Tax=Brachionus plicatilis TaxID=10195 RepID=A0A3M7R9W9_BRAPC|nr:hypothetical protein BpHYR1_019547 [Brachionus plicatilis]
MNFGLFVFLSKKKIPLKAFVLALIWITYSLNKYSKRTVFIIYNFSNENQLFNYSIKFEGLRASCTSHILFSVVTPSKSLKSYLVKFDYRKIIMKFLEVIFKNFVQFI